MRAASIFRRTLSLGLCASLILDVSTASAWADFWAARRVSRTAAPAPQLAALGVLPPLSSSLSAVIHRPQPAVLASPVSGSAQRLAALVPLASANVVEISEGDQTRAPVVILQDVHLNAEAQENSAVVLQALVKEGGVRLVGLEGAFGPVDVSRFQSFPDPAALSFVADAFLKRGLLGASSYLAVTQPRAFRLVGVDDRTHYDANARAVREGAQSRAVVEREIVDVRGALDRAKGRLLNSALRRFDADRSAWSRGEIGIGEYLKSLSSLGAERPPEVDEFIQAYALEKSIDFKRVEAQRRAVLETLAKKLDAAGLNDLLTSALAYRSGSIGMGAYHRGLLSVCRRGGVDLGQVPEFETYVRYVGLAERINAERLFAAVAIFEQRTESLLARTSQERETLRLSAQLDRVAKLVKFSLTPAEWAAYRRDRESLPDLRSAVAVLTAAPLPPTRESLEPFEAFYTEAEFRSHQMVAALMNDDAGGPRVLVTGGYHAPAMRALLQARGCPVIVLSPRLTRVDGDATAYLGVFSREKTPLDRLFAGEKLFLNPVETTVAFAPTTNHIEVEAALVGAGKLPVGERAEGPGGLEMSHPSEGLAHAVVPTPEAPLDVYGSPTTGHGIFYRTLGPAVSGGYILVRRWTTGAIRGIASVNVTAAVRRMAGLESVLKAAALPMLLSVIAPSIAGPAALLTPLGLLLLTVATFALTVAWMGSHLAVDAVRTAVTGDRLLRDWGKMWRGALILNVVSVLAVVGVTGAALMIGATVSPEWIYGAFHGISHVALNGVVGAAAMLSVAAEKDTRQSATASEWIDSDFKGVDLEHYVHAQNRLADELLDKDPSHTGPGSLAAVLSALNLPQLPSDSGDVDQRKKEVSAAYDRIYEALSVGRYDAHLLDLINGDSYTDPRLDVTIGKQSTNPYSQSVYEAVANSLDALIGLQIGQFGKGVKQAIDWLKPGEGDSIEVVTRRANAAPLMLVIRQDAQGRNFIQVKQITMADFRLRLGASAVSGTSVKITTGRKIPRLQSEEAGGLVSQERIIEGIRRRFPFITKANIFVHQAGQPADEVNGFSSKRILVPYGEVARHETEDKNVVVDITDNSISVTDNGRGMDGRPLSRMFVPNRTSKTPAVLAGEDVEAEVAKAHLIHDPETSWPNGTPRPNRVSFARNGEVVFAVDIPASIAKGAAVKGGLMIDLGRLVKVPEARDNINLPAGVEGQPTNFSRGVMHVVEQLLKHPDLPSEEKLQVVNTLVIGLEGLAQSNPHNEKQIRSIRTEIKRLLRPLVDELENAGVVIFPDAAEYRALRVPSDKRVIFLRESLFAWSGSAALKQIGGEVVPGLTLGGAKALPLVIAPFRDDIVARVRNFDEDWHNWPEIERLPVLRTDRFVAIPFELGGRFLELSKKRGDGLTPAEEDEFKSLHEMIEILTSEQVNTNYETGTTKKNSTLSLVRGPISKSKGGIGSMHEDKFLSLPPVGLAASAGTGLPAGSLTRYVHVPSSNRIFDLKTGRFRSVPGLQAMLQMKNNYLYLFGDGSSLKSGLYQMDADGTPQLVDEKYVTPSPGSRFVTGFNGVDTDIFDTEVGREISEGDDHPIGVGFTDNDRYQISIRRNGLTGWKVVKHDLTLAEPDREVILPQSDEKPRWVGIATNGFALVTAVNHENPTIVDFMRGQTIQEPDMQADNYGRFYMFKRDGFWEVRFSDGRVVSESQPGLGFRWASMEYHADGSVTFLGAAPGEKLEVATGVQAVEDAIFFQSLPMNVREGRGAAVASPTVEVLTFTDTGVSVEESPPPSAETREQGARVRARAPNGVEISESQTFEIRVGGQAIRRLPWNSDTHSVTFDGLYFIFTPHSEGPVEFVSAVSPFLHSTASPVKPSTALSDVPPVEIEGTHQIIMRTENFTPHFYLVAQDGKQVPINGAIKSVRRISDNMFEISRPDGSRALTRVKDGEIDFDFAYKIASDDVTNNSAIGTIGPHVVIRKSAGNITKLDSRTGKQEPEVDEMAISPSGKFLASLNEAGFLVIYQLEENGDLTRLKTVSGVSAFRLSPAADIIEVTTSEGPTCLMLSKGEAHAMHGSLEDLTIDDSGLFVLFPEARAIHSLINGQPYEWADGAEGELRIAVTAETAFVALPGGRRIVIDRKSGIETEATRDTKWPAYSRVYQGDSASVMAEPGLPPAGGTIGSLRSIPTAAEEPNRPDRKRLTGNFIVMGKNVYGLDNPEARVFRESTPIDVRFLEKNRLVFAQGHYYYLPADGPALKTYFLAPPLATESGAQVLVRTNEGLILYSDGQGRNITDQVPSGFIPTDALGDTFIFSNAAGEILYGRFPLTEEQAVADDKTIARWNDEVLSQRDRLLGDLAAAWQPLWEVLPKEFRDELKTSFEEEIEELYQEDEKEVERRFSSAVSEGTKIDLATPLPSDSFRRRLLAMTPDLEKALGRQDQPQPGTERDNARLFGGMLSGETGADVKHVYARLMRGLFDLGVSKTFPIEKLDGDAYRMMALGFFMLREEQIEDAHAVASLVNAMLKEDGVRLEIFPPLVRFLARAARREGNRSVVRDQVRKMAAAPGEVLRQLAAALKTPGAEDRLIAYLKGDPGAYEALGALRPFAVYLTEHVEPVESRDYVEPVGTVRYKDPVGPSLAVFQLIEDARPKSGVPGEVMTVDYLVGKLDAARRGEEALPVPDAVQEALLRNNVEVQREAGAYAAEVAQNSIDSTRGMPNGELAISFYTRNRNGIEESVEEMQDNGTGALQEMALNISASTKKKGGQVTQGGFFGSGKFTIFRGFDSVEIITNKRDEATGRNIAHQFNYQVHRDPVTGDIVSINLTMIMELSNADSLPRGVTIRGIKPRAKTIPELDQMLSIRNWKTFAGLSQTDTFRITVPGGKVGERKQVALKVDHETVAEMPYIDENGNNRGTIKLISTKDMPPQVIDRLGVRVKELGDSYLDMIPGPLRRHVAEMGLTVQVPLPLIRNRSGFEHENLAQIQAHVAILFYQALARRVLTETSPQFLFEGFPVDWETNASYWHAISPYSDRELVSLAAAINSGDFKAINLKTLEGLRIPAGQLDKQKRFVKLMLQLRVKVKTENGEEIISPLQRRLAVQQEIDATRAAAQARALGQQAPTTAYIPNRAAKIQQANELRRVEDIVLEDHVFQARTPDEQARHDRFHAYALEIAKLFGMTDVIILQNLPGVSLPFAGLFSGNRMYLNENLVNLRSGRLDLSDGTETIIHELSHLFEALMRGQRTGIVVDVSGLTHDSVGTFAEGMKYAAAVALANHKSAPFQGGNMEWMRSLLNTGLRMLGLPQFSRAGYNSTGSWIFEGALLLAIGSALFFIMPSLDFRTIYNVMWFAFPILHLGDFAFSGGRRDIGTRLGVATLISILMLALPLAAPPSLLILLSFLVHAAVNNGLAAATKEVATPLAVESRAGSVQRITAALKTFTDRAAQTGRLKPGMVRVLNDVVNALPDEEIRVSELQGLGGRAGLLEMVKDVPNFNESDFVIALKAALKDEVAARRVTAEEILPLLSELVEAGVPADALADVAEQAVAGNMKITIVVNGATDEPRVRALLKLILHRIESGEKGRQAKVELVVPADQVARYQALATGWPAQAGILSLIDQPAGLITGDTLSLQRLDRVTSLQSTMLMVPNTLAVNTDGLPANVLRSLLIATIENALSARVISSQTLSNLATLATIVARQA